MLQGENVDSEYLNKNFRYNEKEEVFTANFENFENKLNGLKMKFKPFCMAIFNHKASSLDHKTLSPRKSKIRKP